MTVLEIDNIALSFNKKSILNSIYLKAEKGKITGIIGKNGAGKTALLRIIFGELIPQNKLIRIDKKPHLKPLYKTGKINYLTQFHFIPGNLTVQEIFKFYSQPFADFKAHFSDTFFDKKAAFKTLSGGEKKLVEIFITLHTKTEILLLDEPFSFISPVYIEKIKALISEIKHQKIILITDHFYKDILAVSDDLYLLKNGWSKLLKSPEDLVFYNYTNAL